MRFLVFDLLIPFATAKVWWCLGRRTGRQEMADYLIKEYPQLSYWVKLKGRG